MPSVVAKLEIMLNDNGHVTVNGPIHDRVLCYGLMAVAHDSIKDYNEQLKQQAQTRVLTPSPEEFKALVPGA